MTSSIPKPHAHTHRKAQGWFSLLLGTALLPFATLYTIIPVAAWLATIFLLRFSRTQPIFVALPLVFVVQALGALGSLRTDYFGAPVSASMLAAFCLGYGLVLAVPYMVDRLMAERLRGGARVLAFPLAVTVLHWLLVFSPFPTWGSPAYTQVANLPLIQMVSLTGLWGLIFLMAWLASAVNATWEERFAAESLKKYALPFVLVLVGVLVYGGSRLALAPVTDTVRVAGIAPSSKLWSYPPVQQIAKGTQLERDSFRAKIQPSLQDLFARTELEARAGAKLVVWAETAAWVVQEDEATVLERARRVAQQEGIYLQVGMGVIGNAQTHPYATNYSVLFDPQGRVLWNYHKSYPVPIGDAAEIKAGEPVVPVTDTPFGRWAGIICFDGNTPSFVRQAGQAKTDVMFIPANDWLQNRFDHAHSHVFRAIENGFTLVRPTAKGYSVITDFYGRTLASTDFFTTDQPTMVANIPVKGTTTLYARIGDVFAYLALVGLIALMVVAVVQKGRRK